MSNIFRLAPRSRHKVQPPAPPFISARAWLRPLLEAADEARLAGDHDLADALVAQARHEAERSAA